MAKIVQPSNESAGRKSQLLSIAGAIGGGMIGGPLGASIGGKLGGELGGGSGAPAQNVEAVSLDQPAPAQQAAPEPQGLSLQGGSVEAAQRRLNGPQSQETAADPLQELEEARLVASELPPEQRKEFEPPILSALMRARREQQGAS